jgi:early secretory antigenic target protein ESAT-6
MAMFTVDSDAVLAQSAAIRGTVDRIQGESQAMLGQLVQLQSTWTGQASAAFQETVERWRATQRQVEEALAAVTLALESAGRHYADAELTNAALFR